MSKYFPGEINRTLKEHRLWQAISETRFESETFWIRISSNNTILGRSVIAKSYVHSQQDCFKFQFYSRHKVYFLSYQQNYYTEYDRHSMLFGYEIFWLHKQALCEYVDPFIRANMNARLLINSGYGNPITFQYTMIDKLHSPTANNFSCYRYTHITTGRIVSSISVIHQVARSLRTLDDLLDEAVIELAVAHGAVARGGTAIKWRYIVAGTHFVVRISPNEMA
jgi:hypothetical protein